MHYKKIVQALKRNGYKRVLLTGPQRSGTTITGKILANELGFEYIDEAAIRVDSFDRLFAIYTNKKNFVLQAPGLSAFCHMMPGAVVFMRRPIEDIVKSEERIRWGGREVELRKYFKEEGVISEIKYDIWDNWQKRRPNMFELHYNSIKDHQFYIDEQERRSFKPRQTQE